MLSADARTDPHASPVRSAGRMDTGVRLISIALALAALTVGAWSLTWFGGMNGHPGASPGALLRFVDAAGPVLDVSEAIAGIDAPDRRLSSLFSGGQGRTRLMELRPDPASRYWQTAQVVEFRLGRGARYQVWAVPLASQDSADHSGVDRHGLGRDRFIEGQQPEWLAGLGHTVIQLPSAAIVELPASAKPYRILARIESASDWLPKVRLWPLADAERETIGFHKFGGALVGLFVGLAVFSLAVAVLNRSLVFLLFAAWLMTSLRLAGATGGWDLAWLGLTMDDETVDLVLRIALASHVILSASLFLTLYRRVLTARWIARTVGLLALGGFLLIALSPWISHGVFMRIIYAIAVIGLMTFVIGAIHVLTRRPTSSAIWYAGAYAIWSLGVAGEMLYQLGLTRLLDLGLNLQTSSALAAIIMGISLAETMRDDRFRRQQAQARELRAVQQVESNYEQTPVALFSVDSSLGLRMRNAAFREMFRLRGNGRASDVSLYELLGEPAAADIQAAMRSGDHATLAVSRATPLGPEWYQVTIRRCGEGFEGSVQDISARRAAEERLRHLADHDALTGAMNRRGYEACLARALKRVSGCRSLVLAELFIDHHVRLGEHYGAADMGRILLHLHALIVQRVDAAHVARFGDSFRLVLLGTDTESVRPVLQELLDLIKRTPLVPNRPNVRLSAKVGLLEIRRELALDRAQSYLARACELARQADAQTVTVLSDEDRELAELFESIRAVEQIDVAPLDHSFFLMLQPVVPVQRQSDSLKFEVLLRMRSESGDVIRPDRFIPVAEQAGIMNRIDRWVVEQTLDLLEQNPVFRARVDLLAVNLSGASLNDPMFLSSLLKLLHARPWLARKLCVEITETVALSDVGRTRAFLETIRQLGVRVALDDFGSGYTGWGYLQHLPADILKLDGSIVRDCQRRSVDRLIIRSAVTLARELNMICIAEWAENDATVKLLQSMGVEFVQGFHFAPPLPIDTVIAAERDLRRLLRAAVPLAIETAIAEPADREIPKSLRYEF